ncbi:MAG: hypothetical protein RL318_904 [Fibrobacterota bacterium]
MAIFIVLAVVVIASMLGYMGLTLASSDAKLAGGVMDARSRDAAGRSGMQLALKAFVDNPTNAATQLNLFVADSGLAVVAAHQWFNFNNSPVTLDVNDPGWYAIDSGGNQSAVKVRIVSIDMGSSSGAPGDGVKVTFECTARGRSGDQITLASTYRALGLQIPVVSANVPTNNFALYLNGALANSNMGNEITGNVYINGDTHLNGSATFNITGKLRVYGNFSSNAPVSATENSVIRGDIKVNSGAPMTFSKNLVITGGTDMNASLSVGHNLEIRGSNGGAWNTGTLSVGGQLWIKTECKDIGGKVLVTGNAFFDECLRLTGSGNILKDVYVGRNGGNRDDYIKNTTTVSGKLGSWHTSTPTWTGWGWYTPVFAFYSATTTVTGSALFKNSVEQKSGKAEFNSKVQFWNGIGYIETNAGITVAGEAFLRNSNAQQTFNNGYASFGSDLTMIGDIHDHFGDWGKKWLMTDATKTWKYEATSALGTPDPRVTGYASTNAAAWNAKGSLPLPGELFIALTPVEPTETGPENPYPYTSKDLDLSSLKTWNKPQTSDINAISGIIDLTAANLDSANAQHDNLAAADFQKIWNKFKRADGWAVLRIGATSSIGSLNTPGGTFSGKALWIIEKSVNVNGKWPGSATSSDLQFLWTRGSGSLGNFGSPGNFAGYIRFDNAFVGQMSWGNGGTINDTLAGAIHFAGGGSSVTGNGCNTLVIKNDQAVFDAIAQAFPGALSDPSGASGGGATSTNKLQARQSALQFVPVGEYR